MPVNLGNLNPELLKKFVRQISPGDNLFEQGNLGNTMFIIVAGSFSLIEQRGDSEYVVGTLSSGQILGEKAMLTETPYRRTYTARAIDSATLLEFDNKNLKHVENIIPNFTSRILQIAAKRLDRANAMITILRSFDPVERVVSSIVFLAEDTGKQTPEGLTFSLEVEDIHRICHVNKAVIEDCLNVLKSTKILHFQKDTVTIRDLNALQQYFPELKDRVAA